MLRSFLRDETAESTSTDLVLHLIQCMPCRDRIISWNEKPRLEQILRALADGSDAGVARTGSSDGNSGPDDETNLYPHKPLRRIGQYELIRSIGRGGGGEVFEAMHIRLRRRLAVKLLAKKDTGDETVRRRFLREMESIGQLNHPHIVHAYDAGEADGTLYLAMELVDGENVETLARRVGPLPVAEACEIVRQAALGLQHVHENKLVHRDLKPSNLLTSAAGVKIADLGLALLDRDELQDDQLTGHHTILGTADYIAPEQTAKSHHVDIRADIYSLGCTLFRLLSGRPPYATPENDTPMKKMWAHQAHPVPNVRWFRPDVPVRLAELIQKVMAKNPDDRFATPWELSEALLPFSQTSDVPSLVIPGLVEQTVGSRSSTARDVSDPLRTPSQSSQPTLVQTPPVQVQRQTMMLAAIATGVVLLIGWLGIQQLQWSLNARTPGPVVTPKPPMAPQGSHDSKGTNKSPDSTEELPRLPGQAIVPLGPIAIRWKSELGVVPEDLQWGRPFDLGSATIDEGSRALVVQAEDSIRLAKLGVIDDAERGINLSFQVNRRASRGAFGLFLGYRKDPGDDAQYVEFQLLSVVHLMSNPQGEEVVLRRSQVRYDIKKGSPHVKFNSHIRLQLSNPLDNLTLKVRTQGTALREIEFANVSGAELCTSDQNSFYVKEDYIGPFGLFVDDTSVWFRNPHLE